MVLYISIYNGLNMQMETSKHHRFTIHPGTPDVSQTIKDEASGTIENAPLNLSNNASAHEWYDREKARALVLGKTFTYISNLILVMTPQSHPQYLPLMR
jgi:hypothetical protein